MIPDKFDPSERAYLGSLIYGWVVALKTNDTDQIERIKKEMEETALMFAESAGVIFDSGH